MRCQAVLGYENHYEDDYQHGIYLNDAEDHIGYDDADGYDQDW